MIETLTLRNFKVLREVEVKLRPLTLIVGPNASGKSTILEALAVVTEYLRGRLPSESRLRSRRSKGSFVLGCSGHFRRLRFEFLDDWDERENWVTEPQAAK